jgi:hypothetical protein
VTDSPARKSAGNGEAAVEAARGAALFRFVETVASLPTLRSATGRSAFIGMLRTDIALAVRHDQRARVHTFNLVQACLDREGGLRELLERLCELEGDSHAMRRALELATALSRSPERGATRYG